MDSIHLPNPISLPTTFGASPPPLQPGQVVQALVLELIESDVFRLQLPQATVDVKSDVPLKTGSTITLAVKGNGPKARLVIYADEPARPLIAQNGTPGTARRQPNGEAVVLTRTITLSAKVAVDSPLSRAAPPMPASSTPLTPERALSDAVRVAATRQSGAAPLFADIEQIAKTPDVPAPVRAAARQIAALRVPLDTSLTGRDVKQAFVRSGILLEPKLAQAGRPQASPDFSEMPAAPSGDLKAALLVFRQVLKTWADDTALPGSQTQRGAPVRIAAPAAAPPIARAPVRPDAAPALTLDPASIKHIVGSLADVPADAARAAPLLSPEQATSLAKSVAIQLGAHETPDHPAAYPNGGPPLPYRGAALSAQPPAAPSIGADISPHETAERLLTETEGVIARTTLLQSASLPEQSAQRAEPAAQRWTFEVPFVTPQGTSVAQFEISREGRGTQADAPISVWRARFSLDVEPMGPVHALVALAGPRTSVTLWAERVATATRLNDHAAMLGEALRAAELEPADLQFRTGAPPVVTRQATPGRFMDRAT
jgi:Flagellar hook-length control protein FliK